MQHLDDGTLRRLQDDSLALSEDNRRHYIACVRCQSRFEEIRADTRVVEQSLAVPDVQLNPVPAFDRFQSRVAAEGITPPSGFGARMTAAFHFGGRGFMRPVMVAAAAVALIGAVSLTPAGSVAQSFGTIFQPKQIAVIPIRPGELRTLPPLYKFGTLHTSAPTRMQPVHTAAAAAAASGMAVLQPSSLPAGVPHSPSYEVMPGSTSSFTFSAAKARQTAIAEHRSLPPMPARIDGSTLQLKTGVAVIAVYGKQNDIPPLVVGQMKAPRLSSTGVTVRELEDYVLSLPGVSPQIRAEVKAIGDPTATLPIPLPVNTANAQRVQVQGVTGLAIGDSTGLGSGVVWEKNGIIYGVGGTLTQNQAIDIANSLR